MSEFRLPHWRHNGCSLTTHHILVGCAQHAEEDHRVSAIDLPSGTNPGINSQTHQHGECFMETPPRQ